MKRIFFTYLMVTGFSTFISGQTLKRIDGTELTLGSLDKKILYLMDTARVTGLAISVFNDNQPVYTKTFGLSNAGIQQPLTENSILYAASFAKMLFACIVLQLVDEGKLNLDKPLVDYLDKPLPEYKLPGKNRGYHDLIHDDRYQKITARMCLNHTTGFPNWRWYEMDNKLKIRFEPGSRYGYSGEGLYLLQFVIEKITGKDYETISQERIFKPLGMVNTSQVWQAKFDSALCLGHDSKNEPYPPMKWNDPNAAGSMSTTLSDFTRFYTALINGRGLKESSFLEMTSLQVRIRSKRQFGPLSLQDTTANDEIQLGYGLGVGVLASPYGRAFFKEGNDRGWQHYSIAYPDKKIAVFIMTNSDNGDRIFRELLEYSIGDRFTPWEWENYIPYNLPKNE